MRASKEQKKLMDKQETMLNRVFQQKACSVKDYDDLQTFCAIAIEVMRKCEPALLREAATTVEARDLTKGLRQ